MTNQSHGPLHHKGLRRKAKDAELIVYHRRIPPEYKHVLEALAEPYVKLGDAMYARTSIREKLQELERELAWEERQFKDFQGKWTRDERYDYEHKRQRLMDRLAQARHRLRELEREVEEKKKAIDEKLRAEEPDPPRPPRDFGNSGSGRRREPETQKKTPHRPTLSLKVPPPRTVGGYVHRHRLGPVS
jgi:hypothetical protein